LHWNGHAWSASPFPGCYGLTDVLGTSATNVFATSVDGIIYRWDGARWTAAASSEISVMSWLASSGADDVWVVGRAAAGHWDGASWSYVPWTQVGLGNGLWMSARHDPWIVGSEGVARWDGSAWYRVDLPAPLSGGWAAAGASWAFGQNGGLVHR
jgi:hypothetical protein